MEARGLRGARRLAAVGRLGAASLLVLGLTACSLWPFGQRAAPATPAPTAQGQPAPSQPTPSRPTPSGAASATPLPPRGAAATPTPATAAGAAPLRVDIYDNRLEPARVVLKAGASVTVQIANHGRNDCRFVVQHYPQQIDVPSGQRLGFSFTVPSLPPFLGSLQASAGCQGDPTRSGTITVQP